MNTRQYLKLNMISPVIGVNNERMSELFCVSKFDVLSSNQILHVFRPIFHPSYILNLPLIFAQN